MFSKRGDGFKAYFAHPSARKGPAIVLLSDLVVLDPWIKMTADNFAKNGYIACAPDLYWHSRSAIDADKTKDEGYLQDLNSYPKLDQDTTLGDIECVFNTIKSQSGCNGKIAIIGFSVGGTLSFLTAARLNPDAAIAYYATHIHDHLHEGKHISCQTILHMGKNDRHMTKENTQKIHAALIGKFNIAIYQYQAGHGFANSEYLETFNPEAKALSFQRTFDLLDSLK
ncbi:dienelactone hydrolase family protein [Rhodospirillales bacterium]|nr:dienelactone hydrolase family protein [Rhodospirillales bacterium]